MARQEVTDEEFLPPVEWNTGRERLDHTGKICGLYTLVKFLGWIWNESAKQRSQVYLARDIFGGECKLNTHAISLKCFGGQFYDKESKRKNYLLRNVQQVMIGRCYNSTLDCYYRYGGRGITVCDEWMGKGGFGVFRLWAISNGYQPGLQIDRKNNDGNYEPSNCRWVTPLENVRNKSGLKLNVKLAAHIREKFSSHQGTVRSFSTKIAKELCISVSAVERVIYGETWKNLH